MSIAGYGAFRYLGPCERRDGKYIYLVKILIEASTASIHVPAWISAIFLER